MKREDLVNLKEKLVTKLAEVDQGIERATFARHQLIGRISQLDELIIDIDKNSTGGGS
ncbi:MAG: hypothetical protein PHE15_07135 [Dehalococcoidales bacterium]|nr:hypothetical protein [Dehalococcoidales bacterium]